MENESIEVVEVQEEIVVKKLELPLKQLMKQLFKHLLVYTAIFMGILSLFILSSETRFFTNGNRDLSAEFI